MIDSIEDLRSGGVLPTGPVSAWPKERNVAGKSMKGSSTGVIHDKKVEAGLGKMARGLAQSIKTAATKGQVIPPIREERMDTCRQCPHFIEDTKRCSQCGCFMEAKSWLNGDPKQLCPAKKWVR